MRAFQNILIGLSGLLAFLCACRSPVPAPEEILAAPKAFRASGQSPVPARWWTAFADPDLNRAVKKALSDNYNLAAAWERIRAAEAVYRGATSQKRPELDAFAEARSGETSFGESTEEEYGAGLRASYEVDLWRRIRSKAQAEAFRARATAQDYRTAALSLAAEVSRTWFRLSETKGQARILKEQLEVNNTALSVLRSRFANGQSKAADILRQEQLSEATRDLLLQVQSRHSVLENLLAVLLGKDPVSFRQELPESALPDLPDLPATGLPTDLLRRRPDLKAAYLRLEAANRELAAAVRNRFPRLDLTAGLESTASSPSDLFADWTDQLAASFLGPLFDGGRRRAEVRRREAVEKEQLNLYAQTALDAFREVEDALIREKRQKQRVLSLRRQRQFAAETYERLRVEYLNGAGDYLDVLTALTDRQSLRRTLLQNRRELLETRIALYRALAGGFRTPHEFREDEDNRQEDPS